MTLRCQIRPMAKMPFDPGMPRRNRDSPVRSGNLQFPFAEIRDTTSQLYSTPPASMRWLTSMVSSLTLLAVPISPGFLPQRINRYSDKPRAVAAWVKP